MKNGYDVIYERIFQWVGNENNFAVDIPQNKL